MMGSPRWRRGLRGLHDRQLRAQTAQSAESGPRHQGEVGQVQWVPRLAGSRGSRGWVWIGPSNGRRTGWPPGAARAVIGNSTANAGQRGPWPHAWWPPLPAHGHGHGHGQQCQRPPGRQHRRRLAWTRLPLVVGGRRAATARATARPRSPRREPFEGRSAAGPGTSRQQRERSPVRTGPHKHMLLPGAGACPRGVFSRGPSKTGRGRVICSYHMPRVGTLRCDLIYGPSTQAGGGDAHGGPRSPGLGGCLGRLDVHQRGPDLAGKAPVTCIDAASGPAEVPRQGR